MYLLFSVSVDECVFLRPTQYGTNRWTPGGDIMMAQSHDNGETWTEAQVWPHMRARGRRLEVGGVRYPCQRVTQLLPSSEL